MVTGILGGSFNPIHFGHIELARQLLLKAGLDNIWFMVSPQNPLKKAANLLDDQKRLEMVRAALEGETGLEASDYELEMPKPSYTVDTLRSLKRDNPDKRFVLLMGADNWLCFPLWHEGSAILSLADIIIYPRKGFHVDLLSLPANVRLVDTPLYDVSSTMIRERISRGESIKGLVPERVERIINREGLYKAQ